MRIESVQINQLEILSEKKQHLAHLMIPIDDDHPLISFRFTPDENGAGIIKTHIEIGGWSKELHDEISVRYQGPALQPFRKYRISINTELSSGESVYAEAFFFTGRKDTPWKGEWISDRSYSFRRPQSPAPMSFRKIFCLRGDTEESILYITALGIMNIRLDGEEISDDFFAPGFTDYRRFLQYSAYRLGALKKGKHELLVTVAGGWALGRTTHIANTDKSISGLAGKRQALLGELRLRYPDKEEVLGTDESFEVTETGPLQKADFYDGEVYDARVSWSRWRPALRENLKIHPEIRAAEGVPVLAQEELHAVPVGERPGGIKIYDFGQNFSGIVKICVHGERGQKIVIRHGEALKKDGSLYTENLRSAEQRIVYICRGEKTETYMPRFTCMGFRYIEVSGIEEEKICITAYAVYSGLAEKGSFVCSDERINRLQRNILWSGRSNFVDIPTDCPQRDERQGWTGDIAVFANTALFLFDMKRFLKKWLRDLKYEQSVSGAVPFVVPERPGVTPKITTSCWGDSCILVPYALYREYGDKEILEEMYPVMTKYLAAVQRYSALSCLRWHSPYIFAFPFQFGDWCAPEGGVRDWLSKGPWIGTAYYYQSCRIMSSIAAVTGRTEDAKKYRKLSEKIASAYCRVFTDGSGNLKDPFQAGYVLPLYFGMVRGKEARKMADNLAELIRVNGGHLSTGFTATPYLLFALSDNGHEKEAFQLLMKDTAPSWLYQVRKGATTTWEQWDVIQENGEIKEASMNHYAYGAVGDFLYRRVGGIEPLVPGYRYFRVRPVPGGGLRSAAVRHVCIYGIIDVRWRICSGQFELTLQVPYGTEAEIVLPDGSCEKVSYGIHHRICCYPTDGAEDVRCDQPESKTGKDGR